MVAFISTSSLSGAFSGILAYGIMRMDGIGHRAGWAWIFILEGLFTVVFGLVAFFILPRSPAHARFLDEKEKDFVISRLRSSGAIDDDDADSFSWREVGRTFTLPHVLILSVTFFFCGVILNGLAYFTPTIIASLGYTKANAQLYSVPPFAAAFVVAVISAYLSDRYGARGIVCIFGGSLAVIGFAMFLASNSAHVKYASLFFSITGAYTTLPSLNTWNANNTSPHIRRATAIAFASVMTNSGGILVTWLFGTISPAPLYKEANIILLIFAALIIVGAAVNIGYLSSQNVEKAKIRLETSIEKEKRGLGDRSAWFVYTI
ncbi:hypothetical protein H0H93_015243 [Arthromyces matolae]|nr:hypothetical protein H0H93_015243 [Arthromyces matolae]